MNDIVAKASWHQTVPVNTKMMKIQSAIIVLILQLFLLSAYAQTEQEFWDFEGTGADVEIYGIPNQGIFGSSWNGTSFNGDETDGTGSLCSGRRFNGFHQEVAGGRNGQCPGGIG
jgi:hypothetical protein